MISLKSRTVRILIALFLLVPFILREVDSAYEIYPAVLLPSGAGKVDLSSQTVDFNRYDLLVVLPNGDEQKLDPRRFWEPIPSHYGRYIAARKFGWDSQMQRTRTVGLWHISVTTQRVSSEEEKQETRLWLKSRLERMGIQDAVAVRVRCRYITFDIARQVELDSELRREFDVALVD